MMAANLLCRMFTNLNLLAPDVPVGPNAWGLRSLLELTGPLSELSEGTVSWGSAARSDIVIGVGAPPASPATHRTFFSFCGWDAALEIELTGDEPGPLGLSFRRATAPPRHSFMRPEWLGLNTGQCDRFAYRC